MTLPLPATVYRGNGFGCHTVAALSACFSNYRHADALCFEALTGVPFGSTSRDEDPNRLIVPQMDPDQGLDNAFALLDIIAETQWFLPTEGARAMGLLTEWLQHSPVLLGPIDMGELPYLPSPGLLRGCDHYVAAMYLNHEGIWLLDGEGYCPVVVKPDAFMPAWLAADIPEGRGAFTMRRTKGKTLPVPEPAALMAALRQACQLVASANGASVFLALAEQEQELLAWPSKRRALEFLIPVRGQRNLAAMSLIEKLLGLPECGAVSQYLQAINNHLLAQVKVLGSCIYKLITQQPLCLDGLREVAWREAALTDVFHKLEVI